MTVKYRMCTRSNYFSFKFTVAVEVSRSASIAAIWMFHRKCIKILCSNRSIFIPSFFRDSPFTRKDISPYILSGNRYNKRDTLSRVLTGSPRRVSINRIAVSEYKETRGRNSKYGISQENCGGCPTMAVYRAEKRGTIFGKKVSNLRASIVVEGCGSKGSWCTVSWLGDRSYTYRSYAEFESPMTPLPPAFPSRCSFFFFLILASILTMAVKFIAIVRQEVSRSSFLLLPHPSCPVCSSSLISFLQNASPFPQDEWRFSDEE